MLKKLKNNTHYFEVSQNNPENLLDDFYIFDKKNPALTKYIANTKEIKNILITIKTLKANREKPQVIEKYFQELQKILGDFSNCSEFVCFVNACDNTLSVVKKDIKIVKAITERYLTNRIISESAPAEWIQAILDTNSSRKKGKCGEKKIIAILKGLDFFEAKTWEEFFGQKKSVASFSKMFSLVKVRQNLQAKIKTKKQNKKLDLVIKINERIFLLEAKHINTSGGGQDKQISEMIEILGLKENNPRIHYLTFIDGNYANIIFSAKGGSEKLETQRAEIRKCLQKNERNFCVNTAGLKVLFQDIIQ